MRMTKKITSIVLAVLMVVSMMSVMAVTASAAEETSTVTWGNNNLNNGGTGGMSSGGVTLTTQQAKTRVGDCFYSGRGSATFTAPEGSVFTKIEFKNCSDVNSLNFPSATVAQSGGHSEQNPWDEEPHWIPYYTVTWTGELSEVTFSGAIYGIQSIVFTLKSVAPPTYTVTWKNGDTVLETDTDVAKDAIPAYDGNVPTKASSEDKHYTFSGWSNGTNTYSADSLPAVTADVTYTAQFTEAAHSYTTPSFNWTQDANGDWDCDKLTLSCECGATQDYEVYGFSFGGGAKTSAVTCTADANGDFTYSVSKKIDGVTYSDTKTLDANSVVKSATQLKAAAKKGGSWELGNDIADVTGVSCADGFVLDGNNKTLYAHTSVKTSPMFKSANKTAEYTLKNLTIDGVAGETQLQPAISSATTSTGQTNVINLEGVTITNYDFDAANNGAVLAFGHAEVNLTNCNIDTDSQYDVWGGAASKVNISGGTVGTAYLNGGTSSATVDNGASVTVETSKPESVTIAPGYALNDNGDGTYTVVIDNSSPLNPIEKAAASINDGNKFGLTCDYLKGTLLGVQIKSKESVNAPVTTESQDEEGKKNMRFIAVIDRDLIDDVAVDYGFVLAKVGDKSYGDFDMTKITKDWGNGEKKISAKGTYNNVCGNPRYGDPDDTSTDYKYVTCAVNGVDDTAKVIARFYYTDAQGNTYYAKYAGYDYAYTGCIAGFDGDTLVVD